MNSSRPQCVRSSFVQRVSDRLESGPVGELVTAAAAVSVNTMAASMDELKKATSESETRLAFLQLELDRLAGRAPDVEAAARAAQAAIRDSVEAYLGQGAATRNVTQAQIDLTAAQNKAVDENYSLEQKTLDVAKAQDALKLAQNGVADAADKSAEANRTVFEAFTQQAQAAFDTAVANGNLTGAQEAARAKGQELRDTFVAQQIAAGLSETAANDLATSIGLLPADTALQITLNGAPQALSDADKLKAKLAEINGSSATAYVKIVQTVTAIGNSFTNPFAPKANGGLTLPGGVTAMANGGITAAANGLMRQAMIARAGSNILWAEDETGGEAYIPLAPQKRKRSEEILSKTASYFGGQYVANGTRFMADGGFSGGSGGTSSDNRIYNVTVSNHNDRHPIHPQELVAAIKEAERTGSF